MASRLAKGTKTTRVPSQVPDDWLKLINKAAAKRNISRSQYMSTVAFEQAKRDLGVK